MTVGLGPAKGKDFALSLGPWLVTPDELPYEDGRLAARGDRDGQRRRADPHERRRAALVLARAGRATPRATRACARATSSARARSTAAACSSSGRSRASAGSSPATRSRSPPTASATLATRSLSPSRACVRYSTGRSNSVDRTTCVWVRRMPGASRSRSSASSRCSVSRAWRCRIALASPATVWAAATSGWRPAAARISAAGHPPLAEERDDRVGRPAERDVVEHRRVAADHARPPRAGRPGA